MKSLKIFISLCAFLFCISCGSNIENGNNNGDDNGKETELKHLKGTKWKLAGIMDTQTNVLTELEPKDCADCYTLTFISDTEAEGFGGPHLKLPKMEIIRIDLTMLGELFIELMGREENNWRFISALYSINTKSYSFTSTELKIINTVDNYYLLFKRIKS